MGTYTGAPNTTYTISFYRGCGTDTNNFGTQNVTTNAGGSAPIIFNSTRLQAGGLASPTTVSGTGSVSGSARVLGNTTVTLGSHHQFRDILVNNTNSNLLTPTGFICFLNGSGTPVSSAGVITVNITYNGTAAQSVGTTNINYNRLGINNTAGVTLPLAETVIELLFLERGVFTIGGNLTMANASTIRRTGSSSLSGTSTFGTSVNVRYIDALGNTNIDTGSEIPASTSVLNDLEVFISASGGTLTLMFSPAVNGTLFLNGGNILTGANMLVMNAAASRARTSGHIIGSERKLYSVPGGFIFDVGTTTGYSPATINVDSGAGNFTISATNGTLPGTDPNVTLARFWSLAAAGITQADITFQYLQADVPPGANENQFFSSDAPPG